MSFADERAPEPVVAPLDPARWAAFKRSIEQIDELRDAGHHTAAAIMAATAADRLRDIARDTRLPDYETALRERLIRDSRAAHESRARHATGGRAVIDARKHRDRAVELLLLALKTDSDAARADFVAEALDEHAEHVRAIVKNEIELKGGDSTR